MAIEMFVDVSAEVEADVAAARKEAQEQFGSLLAWLVERGKRRLWDVEEDLWVRLRSLGCALLALWFASRRAPSAPRYVVGPDERRYRWHGSRKTVVKTMLGEVSVRRDFYVIGDGRRGDTFVPLDAEFGLQPSGFSLRATCMAVFLCAKMSFGETRGTLKHFWGWAPATKSLLHMTDQVGPLARPFLEGQPAPLEDGEYLFVLADSKGAPMITETEMSRRRRPHTKLRRKGPGPKWRRRRRKAVRRKRRKKGDKSKNAKMANVGVIYTLRVTAGVIEGPIHKRVYGTFRNMENLMRWLHGEAVKRGYGTKRTVFLADGDRKIWKLQQKYFPKATPCLDWFHVTEKLWSIGECLYAEGTDELADWVSAQLADLRAGRIHQLVRRLQRLATTLPRSGPGTRGKRKRMKQGIGYLKKNQDRMPYDELRRDGLDIGSGAVEGAVRQLGMRLDGQGMRWSPARAEYILQLRCIVINGMWEEFEDYVAHHAHSAVLRPIRPEGLGSTHNARRKKAA
jgi:hypothetical protein